MISIDYKSRLPIYEQLVKKIRELVLEGFYAPGDKLPSVRQLSADLGINPNTVQRAYNTLVQMGVVQTAAGKGIFISEDLSGLLDENKKALFENLKRDVKAVKAAGVSKGETLKKVEEAYDGEGKQND